MKNATNIGMLTAMVFAVGMVGINFSDGSFALQDNTSDASVMDSGSAILGHIEVIHADSEGNILSYQQTDNAIVNVGKNCLARAMFGTQTATDDHSCTDTTPGPYNIVGIGNGTTLVVNGDDTTSVALVGEVDDNNMERGDAVVTVVETQSSSTDDENSITTISAVFTLNGMDGNAVTQAGLFNQTGTALDSVFALKDFPNTVTMNDNDVLTVNWAITIDGTSAMG